MPELKDLFNNAMNGEYAKGSEAFDALMQEKIERVVDAFRSEVAANMLNVKKTEEEPTGE